MTQNHETQSVNSSDKKAFFSLKWKTLVIISLVFTLSNFTVSYIIYNDNSKLFQNQLAESIQNNSSALLSQNRQSLIELGISISFIGRNDALEESEKNLVEYLDNNWDLMELEWGLESLVIYDVSTKEKLFWGIDESLDINSLVKMDMIKGPSTNIICKEYCSIYAKVPMFFMNGKKKYLIIGTGLVDFIINFAKKNDLKAALLRKVKTSTNNSEYIHQWDKNIVGLTDRNEYLPIINQLSQTSTFDHIIEEGKTLITEEDQFFYLYAIPLQNNNGDIETDYLLLANDITQEKNLIFESMKEGILISLIGLICSIVMMFYTLNEPMYRIQRQAKLLPLLAKKRFEEVREKIQRHRKKRFIRNELDILEETAIDLSSELEILHNEIEMRTNELERMALYDVLTGLANRRMYVDQLKNLILDYQGHRDNFAVVFIDLDNFKRINDTLGHDIGDELLIEVAKRLKTAVREIDMVARLGGDEFTLLLPNIRNIQHAKKILNNVLSKFQKPVILNKMEYKITPSIGAAIGPENGTDSDDLMRCADMAMYKSKKNGKNCYFFFNTKMNEELQQEIKLESELLEAIDAKEFKLYYQPIIDLKTGYVVSLEGLLRWQHPSKGLLSPAHFLDMLENNGQIIFLGVQIIELACLGKHFLKNLGLDNIKISLNVSAKQFNNPLFLDRLQDTLDKYHLQPNAFQLEITEQTLMTNIDKQVKLLNNLQALGFNIAIDDFGTGYSSLAYLKELPLDVLKIDASFIRDIPTQSSDMEIVSAVVAMAKKLNIETVAEGIENHEQEQFLKNIDCDYGQGYFYGKAQPIELLLPSLKDRNFHFPPTNSL